MMGRIVRFYNRNRSMIWLVLVTIIGIIMIMKQLKINSQKYANEKGSSSANSATTSNTSNYSIVSKKQIDTKKSSELTKVIVDFITYCNNHDIENAYKLISEDCKQQVFSGDINKFVKNYFDKIFTQNRIYNMDLWIINNSSYTYKVTITGDLLATGSTNSTLEITDYITVIMQDGEYKLNINNYVGKEKVNIEKTFENVTIKLNSKYVYMDYEIYEILIINKNNSRILMDSKNKVNTTYLEGTEGQKYIAFLNEIIDTKLMVESNSNTNISIKFNKSYNPNAKVGKLVFSDIILDYNKFIDNGELTRNIAEIEL